MRDARQRGSDAGSPQLHGSMKAIRHTCSSRRARAVSSLGTLAGLPACLPVTIHAFSQESSAFRRVEFNCSKSQLKTAKGVQIIVSLYVIQCCKLNSALIKRSHHSKGTPCPRARALQCSPCCSFLLLCKGKCRNAQPCTRHAVQRFVWCVSVRKLETAH